MDPKELCWQLMNADTEADVIEILTETGHWDNPDSWEYIGGIENNFSTIGNQQADAVAALAEKIINSVDARLTLACLLDGIDPTGPGAPSSIREAVARFFDHGIDPASERAGRIAHWDDGKTKQEGLKLTVAATGNKPENGYPSISIADAGEGQTPDSFPDTFLSLAKSNKFRIPFVQGKFNMGGTGALLFCSEPSRLQLIVSRRHPNLLQPDASDRDRHWGFTVVRRQPPTGSQRSSVFTYLAPLGGQVLSFASDQLAIFPDDSASGWGGYLRDSGWGTLIKLYEYRWQGTRSNVVSSGDNLLRRIDQALPELALPLRIYECRPYGGHVGSYSTNVLGLSSRLTRDRAGKLEPGFPEGAVINLDGRKVRVGLYAFKKGEATGYRTARNAVIFTINGQSHATLPADFYTRKAVGMSYLRESLLTIVDCSEIGGLLREDLFMNSRDRLRDHEMTKQLVGELEKILRDHPALRELKNRRRREDLDEKLSEDKPLADALESILKTNPTLEKLFLQGQSISAPFPASGGSGGGTSAQFEGKPFPTFFRFRGKADNVPLTRDAHLGNKVRVQFDTDAVNDYFTRFDDAGDHTAYRIGEDRAATVHHDVNVSSLHNGVATMMVGLPGDVAEGDVLTLEIEVSDINQVDPWVNTLTLNIKSPAKNGGGGGGGRRTSANKGRGTSGSASGLALPNVHRVHASDRDKGFHTFGENDALVVVRAGESENDEDIFDFYIYVDNKYLKTAQKESPKVDARLIETKFVYANVLVGLAMVSRSPTVKQNDQAESLEDQVASVSRRLAPVLLPMVDLIGELTTDDLLDEVA